MTSVILNTGENTAEARRQAGLAKDSASTLSPSVDTILLRSALRSFGCIPGPTYRLSSNDIPTIAVGSANGNSTINAQASGNVNVFRTSSKLSFPSGPGIIGGAYSDYRFARGNYTGSSYAHTSYNAMEFLHNGTVFEVSMSGGEGSSGANCRILVNDLIAGTWTISSTGSTYYVKFTFPATGSRRIRIEASGHGFHGVNVASTSEVTDTGRAYPLATIIGDSYPEGTGSDQFAITSEAVVMGRMLGWNIALAASGGTGFLNPGGKVNFAETTRMVDLTLNGVNDANSGIAASPAIGVVMASVNDSGYSSWASIEPSAANFQEAVQRRVFKMIDAWAAVRSGKPLIFFGPTHAGGTPPIDLFRIRDAVQEAVFASGGAQNNYWFIDRFGPNPILRSGVYSSGSDQASLYTYIDGSHPSQSGHNLDGIWMGQQIRDLILTQFV